jgi:hypothetical protein
MHVFLQLTMIVYFLMLEIYVSLYLTYLTIDVIITYNWFCEKFWLHWFCMQQVVNQAHEELIKKIKNWKFASLGIDVYV